MNPNTISQLSSLESAELHFIKCYLLAKLLKFDLIFTHINLFSIYFKTNLNNGNHISTGDRRVWYYY